MSENRDEGTSKDQEHKLYIEALTAKIEKIMNDKVEAMQQDLNNKVKAMQQKLALNQRNQVNHSPEGESQDTSRDPRRQQEKKKARPRREQEINPKPPDDPSRSTRCSPHKNSLTPKSKLNLYSDFQHTNELEPYKFSGNGNYLKWERNMDDWFYYNQLLKEKKLSYAIGWLFGDAYKWWVQEVDDRWYYNEPTITTLEYLKELLRNQYAPKYQNKVPTTTELPRKKVAALPDSKQEKSVNKKIDHGKEITLKNKNKLMIEALKVFFEQIIEKKIDAINQKREQQRQSSAKTDHKKSTLPELSSSPFEPQ